jgi:hypothetical protein
LIGVISGLVGLLVGNRLAWDTNDRNRRASFSGSISEFRAQAERVDNYKFQEWFSDMQVGVEKQCALVESAISWRFRKRFADARKECATPQNQSDLADPRAPVMSLPVGLDRLPEVTYQRGRSRVVGIFDRLLYACK